MSWCKYFTKAQEYTVQHNIFYQEKQMKILLSKNGIMPISKRTKHIKGRCSLAKDKIDNNELEVKHISNEVMQSDVLNQPKQGTTFRVFRGAFINVSENYDDDEQHKNRNTLLLTK